MISSLGGRAVTVGGERSLTAKIKNTDLSIISGVQMRLNTPLRLRPLPREESLPSRREYSGKLLPLSDLYV